MIQEITAQDRGEHRERLFVWEVAPEIKKQESIKQLKFLALMVVVLIVTAYYKIYYADSNPRGRYR